MKGKPAFALVPPDIITNNTSSDVVVVEGQHANLTCVASGNPKPAISWKREDGEEFIIREGKSRKKGMELLKFVQISPMWEKQSWGKISPIFETFIGKS